MKCTLNTESRLSFLPLRDAVLCKDCNFISADAGDTCSVCGGRALLQLGELVRSKADPAFLNVRDVVRFFGLRLSGEAS